MCGNVTAYERAQADPLFNVTVGIGITVPPADVTLPPAVTECGVAALATQGGLSVFVSRRANPYSVLPQAATLSVSGGGAGQEGAVALHALASP